MATAHPTQTGYTIGEGVYKMYREMYTMVPDMTFWETRENVPGQLMELNDQEAVTLVVHPKPIRQKMDAENKVALQRTGKSVPYDTQLSLMRGDAEQKLVDIMFFAQKAESETADAIRLYTRVTERGVMVIRDDRSTPPVLAKSFLVPGSMHWRVGMKLPHAYQLNVNQLYEQPQEVDVRVFGLEPTIKNMKRIMARLKCWEWTVVEIEPSRKAKSTQTQDVRTEKKIDWYLGELNAHRGRLHAMFNEAYIGHIKGNVELEHQFWLDAFAAGLEPDGGMAVMYNAEQRLIHRDFMPGTAWPVYVYASGLDEESGKHRIFFVCAPMKIQHPETGDRLDPQTWLHIHAQKIAAEERAFLGPDPDAA